VQRPQVTDWCMHNNGRIIHRRASRAFRCLAAYSHLNLRSRSVMPATSAAMDSRRLMHPSPKERARLAHYGAGRRRDNMAGGPISVLRYPVDLRRDRELEFLGRGLAMRHQETAEWFTIELAIPMILAVALLLALIVELALRIE
jgi:hypothetical protein